MPAQKQGLFDAEQEGAQDRKDRVEAEGHALEEEGDAVRLGGQEAHAGNEDEGLHVTRPGVEGELRGDRRRGGIDDISQLLVADAFLVRNGLDRRTHQHRAHGASLEEHHAQQPGHQLGGARSAHEPRRDEFGEGLGRAGARPNAHQPAEQPQVEHQNTG